MMQEETKVIYVFCKECKQNIPLTVPISDSVERKGGLLTVVSMHGNPKHCVIYYLDGQFRVRGAELASTYQEAEKPTISETPESSLPIDETTRNLRIDHALDYFGNKKKEALANLSNIITQMILGNTAYFVESDKVSGKSIKEFLSVLFANQNVSMEIIKETDTVEFRGSHPVVFDLTKLKFLTSGMSIKTHYFERLLKDSLNTPRNVLGLQNEISKIFYSYEILREILKTTDKKYLDTELARRIVIDFTLMPILLIMIESEGIATKDRIEFDGLGKAIRSF